MKGTTHALSGAAVWLNWQAPVFDHHHVPSGVGLAVLTVACAGAALGPDADHPSGTVAYSAPPLSKWVCRAVCACTGGHRHGTHSLVSVPAVWVAVWVAARQHPARWAVLKAGEWHPALLWHLPPVLLLLVLVALGCRGLRLSKAMWPVGIAAAALAVWQFGPAEWRLLPWCAAAGWLTHIAGDALTPQGVPVAWPFNKDFRAGVPVLGTVDLHRTWSRENLLGLGLGLFALILVGMSALAYRAPAEAWVTALARAR